MKKEVVCTECGQVHHFPTYDKICQYCQQAKPENEMTLTKGYVTICLECKRTLGEM